MSRVKPSFPKGKGGKPRGKGNHYGGGKGGHGNRTNKDDQSDESLRWVQKDFSKPHPGSIPIEEIKASEEYKNRVESNAPKRKYALCVGYLGSNYQGLQINPDAITVESMLEKALFLAGGMPEVNFGNLQKLQWTRAARTDRGVHAVTQCCAMKLTMALDTDGRAEFRKKVNEFLPIDIRVLAITKVTKNFNSKLFCSKRRYQYFMPTYMLKPLTEMNHLLQDALEKQGPIKNAATAGGYSEPGSVQFLTPEHLTAVRQQLVNFRVSAAQLEVFRAALGRYQGTQPYHNFTTGKAPHDANARRFIISFECGEPTIDEASGLEWVLLSVVGQSFLLNQIRKMVGLAADVSRGAASLEIMASAFSGQKVEVPMAPGQGLYLDELFFEGYNMKMVKSNAMARGPKRTVESVEKEGTKMLKTNQGDALAVGVECEGAQEEEDEGCFEHEVMDWGTNEVSMAAMHAFRDQTILPHIQQLEAAELPFLYYLDFLRVHVHHYVARDYTFQKPLPVAQEAVPEENV